MTSIPPPTPDSGGRPTLQHWLTGVGAAAGAANCVYNKRRCDLDSHKFNGEIRNEFKNQNARPNLSKSKKDENTRRYLDGANLVGESAQSAENFLRSEEAIGSEEIVRQVYTGPGSEALFSLSLPPVSETRLQLEKKSRLSTF